MSIIRRSFLLAALGQRISLYCVFVCMSFCAWFVMISCNLTNEMTEGDNNLPANRHAIMDTILRMRDIDPLESIVTKPFLVNQVAYTTIPKRLHHIWENKAIPSQYVENAKSFLENNPEWEYYFWTHLSGRILLQKKYPELVSLYDAMDTASQRSDLLRYVILYAYGGVYADLNLRNIKPLDRVILSYPLILVQESAEHTFLLKYNTDLVVSNRILFSRPLHPLLKIIIKNIKTCAIRDTSTKCMNITELYLQYNSHKVDAFDESAYLASSQYFLQFRDPYLSKAIEMECVRFKTLQTIEKRACVSFLQKRKHEDHLQSFSYVQYVGDKIKDDTLKYNANDDILLKV